MSVEVIQTISPNTNEPIITRNGPSFGEIESLPKTSAEAFKTWSKTSWEERKKAVLAYADALEKLAPEFGKLLTKEQGKPVGQPIDM